MFKNLLTTEKDLKEAAVIEKRQRDEDERKKRFFDSKQRIIGVDSDGLQHQIWEKEQIKRKQQEEVRKQHEELQLNIQIAEMKEKAIQDQKKQISVEINDYRKQFQQPKDRIEADLNDKLMVTRMDDNDPRLSISGGQMFEGEDLASIARRKEQKLLQKEWLEQQIMEKKQSALNFKKSEDMTSERLYRQDLRRIDLSEKERCEKRDMQRQLREYNETLAAQKKENEIKRKQREQQDNLAEIYNLLTSDILRERTEPCNSNLGPNRVIPTTYKGMSLEACDKLVNDKNNQMLEINKKREDERIMNEQWEHFENQKVREMTLRDRAHARQIKQINTQVKEDNAEMAKEQRQTIDHFNNVVNRNVPTKEYFDQFNTSSR